MNIAATFRSKSKRSPAVNQASGFVGEDGVEEVKRADVAEGQGEII